MSSDRDWYDLTLKELSRLADLSPAETSEDCSRRTVDWARTLLTQVSLIAGLAGIRLPEPYVMDGVWLVWNLSKAQIRAKLWREPHHGDQISEDGQNAAPPDSNFVVSGDISCPENVPGEERTIFSTYEVSGKFTPDFMYSALFDWLSEPPATGMEEVDKTAGTPEKPLSAEPTFREGIDLWISPNETRDIHELVRSEWVRSAGRGDAMQRTSLTFEQMGCLRGDWDGRGSPPPSSETIEFAATLWKNLSEAADATGMRFGRPWAHLLPILRPHDGSPDAIIAVGCLLGRNVLEIQIRKGPDQYVASVALDFGAPSQKEADRGWLLVDIRVMAHGGKSPAIALREVLL